MRSTLLRDSAKHCWPWNKKKGWKGPLPQPRSSPPRTLGDFLVPKIKEAAFRGSHPQELVPGQDPISQMIQISNNEVVGPLSGLLPDVGRKLRWSSRNPGLDFLCRRLAPRSFVRTGRSYAQVVMAGGAATVTGAGGAGGGDQRNGKNYGGQFRAPRGRGRPPRPFGRGRGRYQQGGRGPELRGEGAEFNLVAATRDGDHASHPGISKERKHKGKEMVEGSTSMAGKHKGSQVGEPASKKKRNIILCCEICEEEHFTPHCPLLHGPKPNAMFSGLAGVGLGFFHIPYSKVAKATQKVSTTALIKIIEGSVPAELVKKELARAIPIKWDWEVCVHGNNSYIVSFPCQVELQRMISMKRLRTDNNEGVMSFEEWNNEIKPKQQLQKVWVQVYGVPHEIRSFLPLWAVGSILGVTQRVDMRYLKKTGVVRLMVAVLDVNCIPEDADIVVDDSLYEIFFKVDHIVHTNGGDPEDFDEDDDLDPENRNRDTDQDMEDLHNQNKIGTTFSGPSNDTDNSKSFSKPQQAPNDEAPTAYEVQVAEGAIDKAVQILLEDISASVVAEIDKSSDVYSAVPRPLDGPSSEEILVQEISKDQTLSDVVLDTVTSVQPISLLTSVTEVANGCNGAHVSAIRSTAGQEAECPDQGPMVSRVAMTHILEDQLREDGSGQQDQTIPLQEVFAVSENGPDCGAFAPAVMKEQRSSSIPDFLEFPRVALQALCKKNGIRANSTNVTMASALQLLDVVVGVEDLRGSAAVGAVSSVDFAAEEKEVDKINNDEENMLLSDSKRMVHLKRSQRSSAMSDEHTLKKVERRVAACNLEFTGHFQGNILAAVLGTAAA